MAARSTINRRTFVPPTVTTTSRRIGTTITVSVRRAPCGRRCACHAGICRPSLTPCEACECKVQVVVPCRAGFVQFGQINNRPGRSGRSQDSNALLGHVCGNSVTFSYWTVRQNAFKPLTPGCNQFSPSQAASAFSASFSQQVGIPVEGVGALPSHHFIIGRPPARVILLVDRVHPGIRQAFLPPLGPR